MVNVEAVDLILLAAAALHLGFQATVTAVVYPALVRVPAEQWGTAHHAHSRAITPVVVLVYGSLVVAGGWALGSGPSAWTITALVAAGISLGATALVAAPAHRRLAGARDAPLIRRLLRVDLVRSAGATISLLAALSAALSS